MIDESTSTISGANMPRRAADIIAELRDIEPRVLVGIVMSNEAWMLIRGAALCWPSGPLLAGVSIYLDPTMAGDEVFAYHDRVKLREHLERIRQMFGWTPVASAGQVPKQENENMEQGIELGDTVRDTITACKGVVIGKHFYLYGCIRLSVQPAELKDGRPVDAFTIDEQQAEVVKRASASEQQQRFRAAAPAGPRLDPGRPAVPPR